MNDGLKNKIFSGMFWKFGERILAQGVSFAVSVVLSRLLLPDDYGIVAIVLIFINIANVFVTSGFSTALVQNKKANDVDFSTNFICSLIMSFVVYGVMFAVSPLIAKFYGMTELTVIIRVFSLRIPLSAFSAIQHAYVERHMLFKKYFFSTLFGTLVSGAVGIYMAYNGAGVWALIVQYFTNTIIDILVLLVTIEWKPKLVFSIKSAKKMLGYSSGILLADLSGTFFDQLRGLIIGKIYTSSDLAYYNKGNQLPSLITTNVGESIITVLFPAISTISDDNERVKELTRRATKTMAYIIMPMLFGLACVSKPLVILLFTEKWTQTIPYIQILSISSAIGMIGSVSQQTIKAVGRSDIILKIEFIKKPVYMALLILGAAISPLAISVTMLIYNMYSSIVNSFQLSKVISYSCKQQLFDLFSAFGICLVMCIVVYPISFFDINYWFMIIIQVILGIIIYISLSKLFHNESYFAIRSIIEEKLNATKENL